MSQSSADHLQLSASFPPLDLPPLQSHLSQRHTHSRTDFSRDIKVQAFPPDTSQLCWAIYVAEPLAGLVEALLCPHCDLTSTSAQFCFLSLLSASVDPK